MVVTGPGFYEATSLLAGLVAGAVAVADYLRGETAPSPTPTMLADDLANTVQNQWLTEAKARKLRDPRVLPLAWSGADPWLSADPHNIAGQGQAGRVLRLRLDGRLDGRFDEAIIQLAQGYEQVPSRRLVVLGEPGSGKSVLAIMLTLGLLKEEIRAAGGPVPVLLAVSSWDPVREPMDEWIVRALADSYYSGRTEIPRLLLDHGLLLPILDGLDEIPESARRGAVRAMNRAIGRDRPVVVTCRSAEYEDVIEGGAPVLRQAPVIQVKPVKAQDAIDYLADIDWPDHIDWEPVYRRLRDEPDSSLATALSTPLMVSLARRIYQRCPDDPAELLDTARFGSRHAVEDHLLDRVIDAAYTPDRLPSGQPVPGTDGRWQAAEARRWLTFLAHYLHQHRERDLAWWLLGQRLLSPWVAPAIGLGGGVLLMIAIPVWVLTLDSGALSSNVLTVGGLLGAAFAILAIMAWYVGAKRAPGRLSLTVAGSLDRLRRGFATGLGLSAILAVPGLIAAVVVIAFPVEDGWDTSNTEDYFEALMVVASLASVVGLALAVHSWLDTPPTRSAQATPQAFIRQDRRSALIGALAAGTMLGAMAFPALVVGFTVSTLIQTASTGWSNEPPLRDIAWSHADQILDGLYVSGPLAVGVVAVLPGTVFALLILLTRAWPRFLVARLVLASRGQLPWHLLGFLAHAREQEILRESGGNYQFRHIRLQEWLAGQPLSPVDSPEARTHTTRRRHRTSAATASLAVLALAWFPLDRLPDDPSQTAIITHPESSMKLSADGKLLTAFGTEGGAIKIWNTTNGKELQSLPLPISGEVKFSPDGKLLAINNSRSGETVLWDITENEKFTTPFAIDYVEFSPDGKLLAIQKSGSNEIRLWDITNGEKPQPLPISGEVEFSPDGKLLAINNSSSGETVLWDITENEKFTTLFAIDYVEFSPDGKLMAIQSSGSGIVILWDITNGEKPQPLPISGEVEFSPDGKFLATESFGGSEIGLWDIAENKEFTIPSDIGTGINMTSSRVSVEFSPDGKFLAMWNENSGEIRLWDIINKKEFTVPSAINIVDMEFSPDSKLLAARNGDSWIVKIYKVGQLAK
ncbi:hypothetical protein [Actinocorallia libanotica]|uniref:NACHT domain-containing protein n=1 Tax=Actinocorallia libanotica TaxID=46162 RepID=A0ABN1RF45_9ACTN